MSSRNPLWMEPGPDLEGLAWLPGAGDLRRVGWAFLLLILPLAAAASLQAQGTLPSSKAARAAGSSVAHRDCAKSCHGTHRPSQDRVGGPAFNLEKLCLSCHQGQPAMPTVDQAPRLSTVGVDTSSHVKNRSRRRSLPYRRVVDVGGNQKLVLRDDCSACHDMHGREAGMIRPVAFDTRGQWLGTKPTSFSQVCFGCHAGPEAAPNARLVGDLGQRFGLGAVSRHAIGTSAADRPDLPSLRVTAFRGKLDCTSCHDAPDATGMRGPHVSPNPALLKAPYGREKDAMGAADRANELCLACHSKTSILANQSFPLHNEHITGFVGSATRGGGNDIRLLKSGGRPLPTVQVGRDPQKGRSTGYLPGFGEPTPCATCHEPHGSPTAPGLIEFDKTVVGPSSVGAAEFRRTGPKQGTCTLTCHGYDHIQTRY